MCGVVLLVLLSIGWIYQGKTTRRLALSVAQQGASVLREEEMKTNKKCSGGGVHGGCFQELETC